MERLLIKFTKTGGAKFISHLDTMRTIHRAFRRAGIPLHYSQGFNPHASISVAAPLSLGIASVAEYADVEIHNEMEGAIVKEKLNKVLPESIQIIDVINIYDKKPSSMGSVGGASYSLKLQHKLDLNKLIEVINLILDKKELLKNKRTKSGEKLIDIRPLIHNIKIIDFTENTLTLNCLLISGSNGSLGPDVIGELLQEYSDNLIFGYPEATRQEIYAVNNNNWIDLASYFS